LEWLMHGVWCWHNLAFWGHTDAVMVGLDMIPNGFVRTARALP
jgi:hypothetical protein